MKVDYDFALIELNADEANQYKTDDTFRAKVWTKAEIVHDETDRTVEIRHADTGALIDNYPASE